MARANTRNVRQSPLNDRLTLILLAVFVVVAIATAIVAFFWARSFFADWRMTSLDPGKALAAGPSNSNPGQMPALPTSASKDPMQDQNSPKAEAWDGSSRVTLLVMGLDYRDCDANGNFQDCDTSKASRTDSMMLVTVDPVSKTAGMLAIPRDLWVNIPGYDYGKINTAYFLGVANNVPGGGPALAMQTVESFLGVPVQYYAQIDFNSFVKVIDEIGGVKLDIKEPIKIDPIGPNNTITLQPGKVTLPGNLALAYARNRYTEGGDSDRSKRQQEVILAVRDRILNFNMLPTLVAKAPALYKDVQDGVKTNLTLQQVVQLGWLMQQIPKENIRQGVIGPPNYITFAKSPDGLDIDVPVPDQIRILRDQIFTTGGPVGPAAVATDPAELVRQEKARVVIKNGTPTEGMAGRTSDFLKSKGMDIVGQGNADQQYATSTIIDYTGKPYTVKFLADLLKMDSTRIINRYDPNAQADIEIILGSSFSENDLK